MKAIKLITDSASDLSQDLYRQYEIGVVPFYVTFDKVVYQKEAVEITAKDFFKKLRAENVFPSTSLPSVADYADEFRQWLMQDMDVVCLCLSSKFSGSHQSAVAAKSLMADEFPHRRVAVVDSIQASGGEGVLLYEAVRMRDAGLDFDAVIANIERIKHTARVFLTVDSLAYLQKGGRIGKAAALAGALLQIKPIIVMKDGELSPVSKARGRRNAIQKVLELTEEYVGANKADFHFLVLNADCYEDAIPIQDALRAMGCAVSLPIQGLGVTIGAHTGPTVVAVCLVQRYETLGVL